MPTCDRRAYLNADTASELLANWRDSGMTLRAFAQSNGLSEVTLTRWERRLRSAAASTAVTPAFVQVQPMACGDITVHGNGISVQIPAALVEQTLPTVVRALRC